MSQAQLSDEAKSNRGRVVVAMSGGVDSSVAAALLVEEGYEVIGMMMRLWSEPSNEAVERQNRCCTPDQMADARRVAQHLKIPFYVVDAQQQFYESVVRYFVDEHVAGRTPNPCIECNRQIRFTFLLDRAMALGADYLATGHYARVHRQGDVHTLLCARDRDKDQAYVLHVLGQSELARVLFPVGDYTKHRVREMAQRYGLPVASKSESMDLCFLADGDYRRFLRDRAEKDIVPGPVVNRSGETIGQHSGLVDYTIGQRKGLGLALGSPQYVLAKDHAGNALVVGSVDQLSQTRLRVKDVNWVSGVAPPDSIAVQVKIRYRAIPVPATVVPLSSESAESDVEVLFANPVRGATAGQGAVFFDGDVCLGGGIIYDEGYE